MTIFRLLIIMLLVPSGNLYAMDFELDRGIGFSKGRDVEDWVEAKSISNSNFSRNSNLNRIHSLGSSSLASSFGNSIVIQTQPGSHVVVNASQINHGNQNAEVNLKSLGEPQYKNVEEPTEYDLDRNLQFAK